MGHYIPDLAAQDIQYGLAPPHQGDSCQIQNIASERSWRDVCSKSEYFSYRGRDCHHFTVFFFFFSSPAWTSVPSIALCLPGYTTSRLPYAVSVNRTKYLGISFLSKGWVHSEHVTESKPRMPLQTGAGQAEDTSHGQSYFGSVHSGERRGAWQTPHSTW